MAEIKENRTVIQDYPGAGQRVVEHEYDQVVHERRGPSGGAIAAMVIGAMVAAIVITLIIVNSRDQEFENQLAIERERALAAERSAAQNSSPQAQQPNVVVVPQPQPSTIPVPVPVPVPSPAPSADASSTSKPTATSIEVDVNSKFLDDTELSVYPIQVKFADGAVTLSGEVPKEALKAKAEKVAATVKGVQRVINNITVRE